MLSPKLCHVHLCSRERLIWAEVSGSILMLIPFQTTPWRGGIFEPNLLGTLSCRIPETTLLWAEAVIALWRSSRFLPGLPCTELSPRRVSSLQPGVGDEAAWDEHQDLSPVLPSSYWAGLSHTRGCAWCFVDALDTICAARWSSLSCVWSSWIYPFWQWINKPQVDPSDQEMV